MEKRRFPPEAQSFNLHQELASGNASASLFLQMECQVCIQRYDATIRRPKILPCGHTFCLKCIEELHTRKCPLDSKVFTPSPELLVDNLSLLDACNSFMQLVETTPRLWCRSCNNPATEACVDDGGHAVVTCKKARLDDAGPLLEELDLSEAALDRIAELVSIPEIEEAAEDLRHQLQRTKASLHAARERLLAAREADDAAWGQAKQGAAMAGLSRRADDVVAALSDPSTTCAFTVRCGDVAWRGNVSPAEDAAARLILCRLACGLQRTKREPEEPPSSSEGQESQEEEPPSQGPLQEPRQEGSLLEPLILQEPQGKGPLQESRQHGALLKRQRQGPLQQPRQKGPQQLAPQNHSDYGTPPTPGTPSFVHDVPSVTDTALMPWANAMQPSANYRLRPLLRAPLVSPLRKEPSGSALEIFCDHLRGPQDCSNEMAVEEMAAKMIVGSRVARGRDWDLRWTDDGTPPGPGTVVARTGPASVMVKWDKDATQRPRPNAVGRNGIYRLRLLSPNPLKPHLGAQRGDEILDTDNLSSAQKKKLLTDGSLAQVRFVAGLPCAYSAAWCEKVLQQVAPHLKGLQMVSPSQRHIDVALAMPSLQALCLTDVTAQQLQQVTEIASLRSLEVHGQADSPLPLCAFQGTVSRLKWLRCGIYPLATALGLMRAHADTLEELQLVAASTEPYGCPDLARALQSCNFNSLTRMVLLRQTGFNTPCRHDKATCKVQMGQLCDIFVKNSRVKILSCTACESAVSIA
ncbi:uncharacterized protein LOC117642301 isoform X2 [Thrips palmi]|uniref:Uncharacterized protein LOC117642301 isoform X2 n=1 Tax=Thrips palmi TaxID=161013 RepID=A0A6P8YQ80_THRPL|nr:uncharacterized protein LOC117642301 isoform X2 [Thrips palmi]